MFSPLSGDIKPASRAHLQEIILHEPEEVYQAAQYAVDKLGPSFMQLIDSERRIEAVFTVFVLKDDVSISVAEHPAGSTLHVRSSSRAGNYDFRVNRRRAQRIIREVRKALIEQSYPVSEERAAAS